MRFTPYPNYKASGVDWLGALPKHWDVKRLKYSASINDEALPETTDPTFEMVYVDIGSVDAIRGITRHEVVVFEDAPSRARRIVRDGDTIVSTVRTYLRAITPIRDPEPNTIVSTGFAVVRPHRLNPVFMSYALREPGLVDAIVARSVGVSYPAVSASEIGMLPIPIPPVDEQRAIADLLDRETTKIDTLVTKKRTFIERLKEKRTALISRTVTRGLSPDAATQAGLDPDLSLKPSGIDWLGDVPEHWGVVRLRTLLRQLDQGWSPVASSWPAADGEWGVLKLSAARGGAFIPSQNKALDEGFDAHGAPTSQAGDLLISRSNTPDRVGDVGLVRGDYPRLLIPDLLYRAQLLRHKAIPDFLCWFLLSKSARVQIEADARGSSGSMVKLGQDHIRGWLIPYPPLPEQRAIADFLDRETAKIDAMAAKVEAAIERLQEYRAALITAAVTGKIDVREMGEPGVAAMCGSVPDVVRCAATGCTCSGAGHGGG